MSDMDDMKDRSRDRDRDRNRRERPTRFSEASRDRSNDRGREPRSMKSSHSRVYVSNIPYEYRWQDMKDLFRNQVGDVQFVELFVDENDKPRGSGIVEFSDSNSVAKCLEIMQRFEVKGRKLVIKEDMGNVRDKHGNVIGGKRGGGRDSDRYRDDRRDSMGGNMAMRGPDDTAKWGNTYGLSAQFLQTLHIDAPLSNKVFVANLEYNVDKKKLKEVFRLAGKVIRVEIPVDKDGRSRGFAVVEYDHPVEAVQAISMFHNQVLNDRTMTVRMDRANESFKMPEGLKSVGMGLGPNGEPLKNVAHNLPSLNSNTTQVGAGLLGAVPNNSLQLANALQGLGNVGLGNLTNPQVLQAANLGLLGNGLGATDLSSLVQNPLAQNVSTQQQLAALASQNNSSNLNSNSNLNSFSRGGGGDGGYGNIGSQNSSQGYGSGGGMNSRAFQQGSGNNSNSFGGGGGYGSNDRMNFQSNSNSLMRPGLDRQEGKSFSRKVLVSNLPSNTSYKMLHEKFTEFGDVHSFEERGQGSILITYGSDWQAERAIKNLDKARIDGRMIDARLYF